MSNRSSLKTDPVVHFDEFARDYQYKSIRYSNLASYRNSILVLRAKNATYATITEILNQEGVKVSEAQ